MAEPKTPDDVKLSPAQRAELTGLDGKIKAAEKALATLKKLDMDTRMLDEKLEWAKEARAVLLKEF